jgi:hypothetical protein
MELILLCVNIILQVNLHFIVHLVVNILTEESTNDGNASES